METIQEQIGALQVIVQNQQVSVKRQRFAIVALAGVIVAGGFAQTVDGEFWSWQAKYRDNPKQTLTKNDLDGFSHLSFTYCKGIVKALVMHTSSEPIKQHKLLQISEIGLREFASLDTHHS